MPTLLLQQTYQHPARPHSAQWQDAWPITQRVSARHNLSGHISKLSCCLSTGLPPSTPLSASRHKRKAPDTVSATIK